MNAAATRSDTERIVIGRISGAFGTQGWLKVTSYTRPRDNICDYRPWFLRTNGVWEEHQVLACKPRGASLVAQLDGITDRDSALNRRNADIAIEKVALPPTNPNEFYWSDLIGLEVRNLSGVNLGKISKMLQTGANDVIVVTGESEYLIPYVTGHTVIDVDISAARMLVDWHEDD